MSELPEAKVAIAGDLNEDHVVDWNDGAIAFRDVMHTAQGSEDVKDLVNYRIVMNFASMAPNPYLATADNIKKVYLATDGLPQAVMLKGYGNEGHDSANSEYADIAEREGGVEDFQDLIKIAHDYNTEIGIHVNAQEAYPEAKSFNEEMVSYPTGYLLGNGWGWLDQSHVINKLWDLSSQARLKRLVQLYDRINGTDFYSGDWEEGEYVKDSQGTLNATLEEIAADAAAREDNMDFIYLDVWYQDSWETRRIAEEINSLGWRFSTEFSAEGEYDSTWQHWSTDATYGGSGAKGYNSDIIRFLRNDQRDSQVLNYPEFGGTADNPLLGGYRLYGFEGWGGNQDFDNYILQTFNQNLPTKFLQHYEVIKWVNYGDDGSDETSPVGNTEKEITLKNAEGDRVVVTRNEEQRSDDNIERTITLNGKVILNDVTYLLPWEDDDTGEEKLYHWNLDGGTTTWELQDDWTNLANVVVYKLTDQGRVDEKTVAVNNGSITLEAEAAAAYVIVKGEAAKVKTLKNDFGEYDYVVDPGFNGYAGNNDKLDAADWSGDVEDNAVAVVKSENGDQRLSMISPEKDIAVTTTISGLTKGTDYVAEIYVENLSDCKATFSVDAGEKVVSNYTTSSIAVNYVQCDNEHGSKMQRIQVSFVAEGDTAALTLAREAGEGTTNWDDIRIVEQKVENFQEDGSFEQDFESVVQGLYPFVLSSAQGVSDPVTHLSQLNAPYTQAGWNGRVTEEVTLEDKEIEVGETVTLVPQHEEGTVLKGLVWASSEEEVAAVDGNGVVTGQKAGTATITLSNATGTLAECTITVKGDVVVPKELSIIEHPEDYVGSLVESAFFKVVAEGDGLTYQWQYSNANSSKWYNSSMTGSQTDTITVPVATFRDGQKYRCVVTDQYGNSVTSKVAVMTVGTVEEELAIIEQPESYSGLVGETAVFTVKAVGTNLTYQWQYSNANSSKWYNSSMTGNQTASLEVPVAKYRDGQKYRCIITSESGRQAVTEIAVVYVLTE